MSSAWSSSDTSKGLWPSLDQMGYRRNNIRFGAESQPRWVTFGQGLFRHMALVMLPGSE